jgi:hypothetical protein
MSEKIQIQKTIYSLQGFNNVVDTNFTQLVQQTTPSSSLTIDQSVNQFFNDYNNLFYDIPLSGSDESHLGLATRSLEYLGVSLEDYQTEIDDLRQENVALKTQVVQLTNINVGNTAI